MSSIDVPDVSVLIPCRTEQTNAEAIASLVIAELEPLGGTFDTIFIARGKAVIGMCADFQDPPALLPQFIARWRAGVDIVLGVRESEKSGLILGNTRKLSCALACSFGDHAIIPNAAGLGLYDRKVVDANTAKNEPEPFFRGMPVKTGFPLETITYRRPQPARGKSNNIFFALLDFVIGGLTASSKRLLRVPLYVGVLAALATLIMGFGGVTAFTLGRPIAGWFIAMVLQAQFAILFGFIGLMGDQIRLISECTRRIPLVLARERVNFPADC